MAITKIYEYELHNVKMKKVSGVIDWSKIRTEILI